MTKQNIVLSCLFIFLISSINFSCEKNNSSESNFTYEVGIRRNLPEKTPTVVANPIGGFSQN
jgi:hypothetical protein